MKTIHEELESLSQSMNRIGQRMMKHKDSLYQMHGASLIESGEVIISWSMTLKEMADGLDSSSTEADETVRAEAEDEMDTSEEE